MIGRLCNGHHWHENEYRIIRNASYRVYLAAITKVNLPRHMASREGMAADLDPCVCDITYTLDMHP